MIRYDPILLDPIHINFFVLCTIIVSEYDQEIPQSQTADQPMAPRGRVTQQSQETLGSKLRKATSSHFPVKMIAKLEGTKRNIQQNIE